jgi:cell division protease FtsH
MYGEDHLYDMLSVMLGGRAGELVFLGQGSTGAANDLGRATELATKMVREFGLSSRIGPVGYPSGGSVFLGGGGAVLSSRPFAEQTQAAIDDKVARLVKEAEQRAGEILKNHHDVYPQLVALLLERETVDGGQVYALAGRAPPGGGATMSPEDALHLAERGEASQRGGHAASGSGPDTRTSPAGPLSW